MLSGPTRRATTAELDERTGAAAIPTHVPDHLEQMADDLPGFAAGPRPMRAMGLLAAYRSAPG
jgi:hypothetical protein